MSNNLHLCYSSVLNVVEYAQPTSIFVTGRTNRNDPAFQTARQKGAEILEYYNVAETRTSVVSQMNEAFYMGNSASVPRWLGPDGQPRENFVENGVAVTELLDIRPGSAWIDFAIAFLCERMESGKCDGVFLDVLGGKLWGGASGFNSWSVAERKEWQAANVSFVSRLDYERRRRNPDFIIVNNNTWQQNISGEPMLISTEGERCVDGVCIEGHDPITNPFVASYASRPFNDLGRRRVLTIARSSASALRWAAIPGVTHVSACDQDGDGKADYGKASAPVVPGVDLRPVTIGGLQAEISQLKAELADARASYSSLDAAYETTRVSLLAANAKVSELQGALNRDRSALNEALATVEKIRAAAKTLFDAAQGAL